MPLSNTKSTILSLALLLSAGEIDAFAPNVHFGRAPTTTAFHTTTRSLPTTTLQVTSLDQEQKDVSVNSQVEKLMFTANKLRAEAAALEAEKANEMAQATQKAFQKFDLNQDGEVSLDELKAGLEKVFKIDLPESRVQDLMNSFDANGDGALQLEEFVGVDKFRNQLDQIARQEQEIARQAAKSAQLEAEMTKEAETRLALISESINEKEPTNAEKALSVLPYLLPLMDSLQFGGHLLAAHQDNPLVLGLANLYQLYRSVPLGGFVAYFMLSTLGNNLGINKLVRFNMKQAISLDIALFIPAIIATIGAFLAGGGGGIELPTGVAEMSQDAAFIAMLTLIGYSSVSSLLGTTPDKVPFISDRVTQQMPSIEMFDEQGQFIQREEDGKMED